MLTISEITKQIKNTLESSFDNIELVGEISNFTRHQSGHRYFVLKDNSAQISAIMWQSVRINFEPRNGMKVVVRGSIDVYAPQGKYQIICRSMVAQGEGDLYLAYEALKVKLSEKGYFEAERKKRLKQLPLKIGISTSPTGAALHDMIQTINRRNKLVQIYFRPTLVQGDGSADDIVRAIEELNQFDCDAIIIGRGGGSIEDLWSYNTEIVANTIFNSKTIIISAVGHETDFTISDFVADYRASTPTAAAELVTSITHNDILEAHERILIDLKNLMKRKFEKYNDFLGVNLDTKIIRPISNLISTNKQKIDYMDSILKLKTSNKIKSYVEKLDFLDKRLNSNNPLLPLNKGYALLSSNNHYITNNESLQDYESIEIIRKNETIKINLKENK